MALEYRTLSGSTGSPVEVTTRDAAQHADAIPVLSADDTLPPTPIDDLVAAAGLQVHVLAADAAVREGVRRACGDRYAFAVADDWSSLLEAIDARRCDIAVIEASLLGVRLEKCITDLGRDGRHAVTLVAADRKEAQRLIGFLSERRIHRLLIKPPAAGITRLLIESAANRCLQLRSAALASPQVVSSPPRKAIARFPTWMIAASAAVVFIAIALAVASYRAGSNRTATAAADQAATVVAAPIDRFADVVASAEVAFKEGRLAAPAGDNALDYYLNVLAAEPTHGKARDGLASVVDALFATAENALLMGSLDAAATSLDAIRKTAPTSGRLAFLDAQLALARARADAAKPAARGNDKATSASPPATGDSAAQAELEKVLDAATTRLRRGELLDPAGDSALRNLDRATQLAGTDPRVVRLRSELTAALISSARTVVDAGDLNAGVRLADAARTLGADAGTMSAVDQKIAATRATQQTQRLASTVQKARARIQAGALVPPAEDNALTILTSVEKDAPQTAGLGEAFDALVGAIANSVRSAIARADWPAAESDVKALEATGHAPALASSLVRDLATARTQEQYLATASPASELTLVSFVTAVYPSDAQFRQIEGWVEVEFVVDRAGLTRDLRVRQAMPPGRFEQSALLAIAKYRYEPFTRDGQIYERRVYVRLRYGLK
jgi:protein TonB